MGLAGMKATFEGRRLPAPASGNVTRGISVSFAGYPPTIRYVVARVTSGKRNARWLAAGLLVAAVTVGAVAAGVWLTKSRDSVTRWHVPSVIYYHQVKYPLYDKERCWTQSAVAGSLGTRLRRDGSDSGHIRFVPIGPEPEMVFLQPTGHQ